MAVVGVGQEQCGDDTAGVLVARELRRILPDDIGVLEAGVAPENCSAWLRRFAPDAVILIDAAFMGDVPGTIRLLDWRESDGLSASTHALPLSMVCQYWTDELACEVILLVIQAESVELGQHPCAQVQFAVNAIIREFVQHDLFVKICTK